MLVNVNKFKPYKYMEFKFFKQKKQMYWEQNASGVQEVNSDTKKDDERCAI